MQGRDGEDGYAFGEIAENEGEAGGGDEDQDHGLDELGQKHFPGGAGDGFLQFVGAVARQPGGGFGGGEAVGGGAQGGEDLLGGVDMRRTHEPSFSLDMQKAPFGAGH